jgi:hypothetical protein
VEDTKHSPKKKRKKVFGPKPKPSEGSVKKITSKPRIAPATFARDIVARYKLRGSVLPCRWSHHDDPVRDQELTDALKLTRWKLAMKGNRTGYGVCSDEVRDYLDDNMPGWRLDRCTLNRASASTASSKVGSAEMQASGGVVSQQEIVAAPGGLTHDAGVPMTLENEVGDNA